MHWSIGGSPTISIMFTMSDMFRSRLCGISCIVSEPATALQGTYPYDILCAI